MRRARLPAAMAALVLASCESPLLPGRTTVDVYEFTLPSTPPAVLRWPAGAVVRAYVAPAGDATRDDLLLRAAEAGAAAWNLVALFGEYRIEVVPELARADVVITWSDVQPPVETTQCRPALARAVTTFCVRDFGTDSAHLGAFPLRGAADPGSSTVRMLVTVLGTESLFPDRVGRLVAHELGHVLGLGRHSNDANDLLWFDDVPATDRPSARDAATVQVLYHTRPEIVP